MGTSNSMAHDEPPFPHRILARKREEKNIPSHSLNIIVYVANREKYYPIGIYDTFNHPIFRQSHPSYVAYRRVIHAHLQNCYKLS